VCDGSVQRSLAEQERIIESATMRPFDPKKPKPMNMSMQSSLAEQERIIGAGYADMLASMRARASTLPAAAAGAEAIGSAAGAAEPASKTLNPLPLSPITVAPHLQRAAPATAENVLHSLRLLRSQGGTVSWWLWHWLLRLFSNASSALLTAAACSVWPPSEQGLSRRA
jgi:hypothetical protein